MYGVMLKPHVQVPRFFPKEQLLYAKQLEDQSPKSNHCLQFPPQDYFAWSKNLLKYISNSFFDDRVYVATSKVIAKLLSLNNSFPDTSKQMSDEKRGGVGNEQGFDLAEIELDGEPNFH